MAALIKLATCILVTVAVAGVTYGIVFTALDTGLYGV